MSYSTCSFNPLENEAVVAALLRTTQGALELVDCPPLDGLPARSGLKTWQVTDETLGPLSEYGDVKKRLLKVERRRFRRTMWPPSAGKRGSGSLERCLRFLPFQRNTGGFFVALLRKRSEWPPLRVPKPLVETSRLPGGSGVGVSEARRRSADTLPTCRKETLEELRAVFGSLPSSWPEQLYTRGARRVFICTPSLTTLLRTKRPRKLAVVAAGVCVAERQKRRRCRGETLREDVDCTWQPTAAGMSLLAAESGRATEANAKSALKLREEHLCAGCGRTRLGSCFSRKMLTRPPAKRRCTECVVPPQPQQRQR